MNNFNNNCLTPVGTIVTYVGQLNATGSEDYGISPELMGWMICDGRKLETVKYPELFLALGYMYGGEDTYFNIPDLSKAESPLPKDVTVHYLIKFTY